MSKLLGVLFVLVVHKFEFCTAGCSGVVDLPLKMGPTSTKVIIGAKSYTQKNVNTLARVLVSDIPGITLAYAKVMAEDALNIEENFEITYRFFIFAGTAKLSQFKVKSTTLHNHGVNINWNILEAKVTYTAQRDITVHARRRRRWLFGGRRRCARQVSNRGVNKAEISRIQSTLTSVMNKVGTTTKTFIHKRITDVKQMKSLNMGGTCSAWKATLFTSMDRSCSKRSGVVPQPYTNPVPQRPKRGESGGGSGRRGISELRILQH